MKNARAATRSLTNSAIGLGTNNVSIWALFILLRIVVGGIVLGIQLYFYRTLKSMMTPRSRRGWVIKVLRLLFAIFSTPIIVLLFWPAFLSHVPATIGAIIFYPTYCWHFSWFIVFLFIVLESLLNFLVASARKLLPRQRSHNAHRSNAEVAFEPTRRNFLQKSVVAAAGTIFSISTYGAITHDQFEMTRISILINNLPSAFDGFTVALLSDIHSSIFMSRATMEEYVKATMELRPNLISVTGDFVNSMVEEVYPFAEAFSGLSAPHGVFGVLGNHDYYTHNVERVARVVNECGIRLLRNEHVVVEKEDAKITLAGIDDAGNFSVAQQLLDRSMVWASEKFPKILLSHRPYYLREFLSRGIDLTLSGHTHGGQIVLARFGNDVIAPARMASPYVAGLYSLSSSQMYVSRGIGTVAVPIRVNCPPEITLITLKSDLVRPS